MDVDLNFPWSRAPINFNSRDFNSDWRGINNSLIAAHFPAYVFRGYARDQMVLIAAVWLRWEEKRTQGHVWNC